MKASAEGSISREVGTLCAGRQSRGAVRPILAAFIALRFVAEVESARQLDELLTSIPLRAIAETRVTLLIEFSDRRAHVLTLLQHLTPHDA